MESTNLSEALRHVNISNFAGLENKPYNCGAHQQINTCRRCNYPNTSWGPTPVPADEATEAIKLKQHRFTPEFLESVWPEYHKPPTSLAEMDAEETAIWIEILARFKGWQEAKTYAKSFKTNDVTGYVLPCLSVKALRSKLKISKFGHRLEIMTAIENSELTLMNPVIVSLHPNIWFKQMVKAIETSSCNSSSQHNCSQWVNPKEKSNRHAQEVSKWLSKKPNKPWLPKNGQNGGATRRAGYFGAHWISDPELYGLRIFGETGPWYSESDSYNRMIRGCSTRPVKSNRFNSSKRGSNYPWIPPIQLPPSMLNFDEKKKPEQERLSSIFSTGNSATASCGKQARKVNGNFRGGLATEVDLQQEIKKEVCYFKQDIFPNLI